MEQIVIYKRDGTIRYRLTSYAKLCTLKSAEQKIELLGEDTVTVKTNSTQPMELVVGDYIEIFGSKYTLNRVNEPTKISERKFENSMVFEGLQYKLIDAQYRNTDAAGHNPSADFPIVANMWLLMQLLINNINRVASSLDEVWELGDCPETEHKEYTFSNENCLEVLQRVCKDNNIEFEIEAVTTKRFKLHIRKVGKLFPATFTYGKGGGIYKLTRKNVNSNNLITRLYIEGGTRNIASKYRNGALRLRIGDNEESYIENATAKAAFGLKEGSRTYDDIYPHRTGTVTGLVAGQPLKFVDSEMFDLNEKDIEGQTKWLIADTAAKIKFVGNCNLSGYQFEIASYDTATKTFTLNLYEDSRGLKIPDGQAYTIEEDAEYVLLDIVMPNDPYVVDAEAELKAAGKKDLEQDSQPKMEYELELSSLELKRRFGSEAGIVNLFAVGDYLPIKDPDINVAKAIRIKGFTRDCCSDPYKYKVTLSDTVEVSLIQQIIEDNAEIGRIIVLNDLTNVAKARANWRTTQELLGMVFDGDGYFDTSNIRPNSIETLMLSVGNRAGQFVLRNIFIEANTPVGGKPNPNVLRITSQGGHLIHYAIEETDRTWMMSGVQLTLTTGAPLYIYAVCPKAGSAGTFMASATKMATDTGSDYYFPVGVLSSVFNGYREVTTTYGTTRITGRCINCGRIESIDKSTYFDLDNGEIGGNIKFKSTDGTLKDINTIEAGVTGAIDTIKAITDNYTEIDGGLILSTFLKLGAVLSSGIYQESAGLKAMLANTNEIAAYFGGTYAEALAGIKNCMTIIYHNGKLKAKNAEITGIINAKSGTIGSLAIVGNNLIGLDENGIERVRISIGSLPSVDSVFTTSSVKYSLSSTNASCSYPTLEHGYYTAYAERTGCEISTNVDDDNYTNNAYLTATVGFILDKDATEVTFSRFDGGYSTNHCSNTNKSPIVSGVANLYRVTGSSLTKVGSFPIEEQGNDHTFNSLTKGSYQLEISVDLSYDDEYWYGNVQLWIGGGILVTTSSTASGNGTNILAKDGILSMRDGTHYMMFSFNNGFEARFGNSGFRVSNAGVQKLNSSGAWQTANI